MIAQRWVARCVATGCLVWLASSHAADSLGGLLACRTVADSNARLACFDRESAALAGKAPPPAAAGPSVSAPAVAGPVAAPAAVPSRPVAAAPAPAAVPAPVIPAPDPKQQFGLPEKAVAQQEVAAGARAADALKIEAHIVQVSQTSNGRAVMTLDNDQVWRQLVIDVDLLVKPGDAVTITRGVFNSYWLQAKNGRGCKVTRLR